jgi:glucokinase
MPVPPIVAGIDLGGTSVRAGVVDAQANILARRQVPIEAKKGPQAGIERIIQLITDLLHEAGDLPLAGIGIGATGPIDPINGVINNPYTLPSWDNVPITAAIQSHFQLPVILENDADAAALGEFWAGAGKGVSHLYAVTVGTGIGTAFIQNGAIYRGLNGVHPEGGHHIVDPTQALCYCGAHGCWESLASGTAIAEQARKRLPAYPDTLILQMSNQDPSQITSKKVAEAAMLNDPLALEVIHRAARYLALGLINIITLFVPQVIVLSGGVMNNPGLFMPVIEETIQQHNTMVPASQVKILPAALGDQAGLYGAACAILQKIKNG